MRKSLLFWLSILLPALLALGLLALVFLPYSVLKAFLGSLTADGSFNSLKPFNWGVFRAVFLAGGIFLFGFSALSALRLWRRIGAWLAQLWLDFTRSLKTLRPPRSEVVSLVILGFIMLLAVVFRLEFIDSPLHHDEAYTYIAFGRSFFSALSDYHLPNNHVFHSLLVVLSTRLLGNAPWAVRLPAFAAGVLLVPAVYWLGRRLYSRWVGLAAAFLAAWLPALISYSNNARGYTLVALSGVLILALGDVVRREKNRFAWLLISLFSALGFFTVPVMAFPFGILFLWLLLEALAGDTVYASRFEFLRYWLASGIAAALLTLLFYLPVLVYSGPAKLFGNDFVAPLSWAALPGTLAHRFSETWTEWSFRVPPLLLILAGIGFLLGLVFHRRVSRVRVPLQVAAFLWIIALLLIQRPNAWSKVWVFLQPLVLLWCAAGVAGLLAELRFPAFLRRLSAAPLLVALLLLAGSIHALRLIPDLPAAWSEKGAEEQAVLSLQGQITADDLLVVAPTSDAAVWYYSALHRLPVQYGKSQAGFRRAFVVVNRSEDQTCASVLQERGPAGSLLQPASARLLETIGSLEIFELSVDQE